MVASQKATVSQRNEAWRMAWPTSSEALRCSGARSSLAAARNCCVARYCGVPAPSGRRPRSSGRRLSSSACGAIVPTANTIARVINEWRQPSTWTSQPANGMNTVLAKPAISVIAVSAWTRLRSNQRLAVAKAGSYSVADMVSPIAAQIR